MDHQDVRLPVLLHDPKPFPLLAVEEPEISCIRELLQELAEEFRDYARRAAGFCFHGILLSS